MANEFQAWTPLKKRLEISSTVENIHQVESLIEEIRQELDFKDDIYGNVMVAITEAVNNGIVHGNQSDISKKVYISFEQLNPFRLLVMVEDEGPGFDPASLRDPTAPENLESPGGRGVFLMQHLSNELKFGNNGRRVEMIFNI